VDAIATAAKAGWSLQRLGTLAVATAAAVAVIRSVSLTQGVNPIYLYQSPHTRLDAPSSAPPFGVMYVAGWLDRLGPRAATALGVAAIGGIAATARLAVPHQRSLYQGLYTAIAVAGAALVVSALQCGAWLRWALTAPPLVAVGATSYSLYLWHLPVFLWLRRNAPGWSLGPAVAASVTTALAVSWLSYRFVERPFLRRRRSAHRDPAGAPAPARAS
jgi:peptidoglycan/LPS O-acetylase OafA/YrhL